jgi:hypothetical protein
MQASVVTAISKYLLGSTIVEKDSCHSIPFATRRSVSTEKIHLP